MKTAKQIFWGVLATTLAVLGFVLFGKLKKLKKLEVESKINQYENELDKQQEKVAKARRKVADNATKYQDAMARYRAACEQLERESRGSDNPDESDGSDEPDSAA